MAATQQCILIVDDMEDLLDALSEQLVSDGYKVKTANNGYDALAILATVPCKVVLTDILMPDMDGIELAQTINRQYPASNIILMTGGGRDRHFAGDFDYLDMASRLTGIEHVLRKPFEYPALRDMLDSLLQQE
jgi:two-component system response regulator YesN